MLDAEAACPFCHHDAPVVFRGLRSYCSACQRPRSPLSATPLGLVGQPSRIGGAIARGVAWAILVGAVIAALVLGGVAQLLWPASYVGWVIGVPIALGGALVSVLLLMGGGKLARSGEAAERGAYEQALTSMALQHGGALTADDAARALGVTYERADELLTELAKEPDHDVSVDVDDDGRVLFRFGRAAIERPKIRVPEDAGAIEPEDEGSRSQGTRSDSVRS